MEQILYYPILTHIIITECYILTPLIPPCIQTPHGVNTRTTGLRQEHVNWSSSAKTLSRIWFFFSCWINTSLRSNYLSAHLLRNKSITWVMLLVRQEWPLTLLKLLIFRHGLLHNLSRMWEASWGLLDFIVNLWKILALSANHWPICLRKVSCFNGLILMKRLFKLWSLPSALH